jgi:pimeloyl-ACP methyl ester carboxylesterase
VEIQVGDVRLAGADTGTGDPIVLLHGLASTHRWWDLVVPRLPGYRVVRFDHRGHGGSDTPPGGYDLEHLATDTVGVLDALRIDRAVLAGHSLGAAVALRVAAARPDRVTALACVEGGVYDPRLLFGTAWEQARAVMTRPRRGRVTASVLGAWLASTDLPAGALPAIVANYTETGPDGGLRLRLPAAHEEDLARDLWRQDPVPLLSAVRVAAESSRIRAAVPVLAVAARQGDPRQDRPRRASLQRARVLLGARLSVRWVAGGHELPLQRPDDIAGALADLAARVPETISPVLASDHPRGKISATWR